MRQHVRRDPWPGLVAVLFFSSTRVSPAYREKTNGSGQRSHPFLCLPRPHGRFEHVISFANLIERSQWITLLSSHYVSFRRLSLGFEGLISDVDAWDYSMRSVDEWRWWTTTWDYSMMYFDVLVDKSRGSKNHEIIPWDQLTNNFMSSFDEICWRLALMNDVHE